MNNGTKKADLDNIIITHSNQAHQHIDQSQGGWLKKLAIAAALSMPMMQSCDKPTDPTPVVQPVDNIDRTTDNPAHLADFMKDVKPRVLGDSIATMEFDGVWTGKNYELKPKSMVDFDKAAQELVNFARENGWNASDLRFGFYYTDNKDVRIAWSISYDLIIKLNGLRNLNDDQFDTYRVISDVIPDGGDPDATVLKGTNGFLSIDIANKNNQILREIDKISPYYFGL